MINFDVNSYKEAISSKDGMGMFYDDQEEHQTSVVLNLDRSNEEGLHKVEVKTVKLDTFIKKHNIHTIDLIKIDVETHEPEVMDGFKEYLSIYKPTMLIEVIRDNVALSLHSQLSGLGYNYFYISDPIGGNDLDFSDSSDIYSKVDTFIGGKFGNYLVCRDDIAIKLNLSPSGLGSFS